MAHWVRRLGNKGLFGIRWAVLPKLCKAVIAVFAGWRARRGVQQKAIKREKKYIGGNCMRKNLIKN